MDQYEDLTGVTLSSFKDLLKASLQHGTKYETGDLPDLSFITSKNSLSSAGVTTLNTPAYPTFLLFTHIGYRMDKSVITSVDDLFVYVAINTTTYDYRVSLGRGKGSIVYLDFESFEDEGEVQEFLRILPARVMEHML